MKYLPVVLFLFFSSNSFSMFCPTSFKQINIGDTIDQVVKTCGRGSSQTSHNKVTILSEEWVYYVKSNVNSNASEKMIVIFSNNKVINISLDSNNASQTEFYQVGNQPVVNIAYNNNQMLKSVGATNACGPIIILGDTMQKVESSCGKPSFIKQNQSPLAQNAPLEITELQYGGMNPAKLIFENGVLKDRVM